MSTTEYFTIAIRLLMYGNHIQRERIRNCIRNFSGDDLSRELKVFIDSEIENGKIELT